MAVIRSRAELDRWAAFATAQGFPLSVEAKKWKPTRTSEQNAYLWGVCYATLGPAMGYDPEDLHEYFCGRMYGWKDVKVPKTPRNPEGLASTPIRTTTRDADGKRSTLSKKEFSEFVEMVHRVAAGAGVFIPDAEAV